MWWTASLSRISIPAHPECERSEHIEGAIWTNPVG
jgi:hypothetical protein